MNQNQTRRHLQLCLAPLACLTHHKSSPSLLLLQVTQALKQTKPTNEPKHTLQESSQPFRPNLYGEKVLWTSGTFEWQVYFFLKFGHMSTKSRVMSKVSHTFGGGFFPEKYATFLLACDTFSGCLVDRRDGRAYDGHALRLSRASCFQELSMRNLHCLHFL